MTHESLPAARVSTDTAAGKERPLPRDVQIPPTPEQVHSTELEKHAFLRHLALEAQAAYYFADSDMMRTKVHESLMANIAVFAGGTEQEQKDLFFALLCAVDIEAEALSHVLLEKYSQKVMRETPLEVLSPMPEIAEPATLMLPVTPEDNLEDAYSQPATEFDTPISLSLSELWQRPLFTARKIGRRTLEKAGIFRSVE